MERVLTIFYRRQKITDIESHNGYKKVSRVSHPRGYSRGVIRKLGFKPTDCARQRVARITRAAAVQTCSVRSLQAAGLTGKIGGKPHRSETSCAAEGRQRVALRIPWAMQAYYACTAAYYACTAANDVGMEHGRGVGQTRICR